MFFTRYFIIKRCFGILDLFGVLKTVCNTRSGLKHKSTGRSSRHQKLNSFGDSYTRVVRGRNMVLFIF